MENKKKITVLKLSILYQKSSSVNAKIQATKQDYIHGSVLGKYDIKTSFI